MYISPTKKYISTDRSRSAVLYYSSYKHWRPLEALVSCEHGIRGSLPSTSPALLSLTSHRSKSLLSSCTATLSFSSQQSYNTLTLITSFPKARKAKVHFWTGVVLFNHSLGTWILVEFVYVWFLKHTSTSIYVPSQ